MIFLHHLSFRRFCREEEVIALIYNSIRTTMRYTDVIKKILEK